LPEFMRDARRDRTRRNPARLRVADEAALAATRREADLGELGRLARAGLAAHDDDRVQADRARDLVGALRDGQVRRISDGRFGGSTRLAPGHRMLEIGSHRWGYHYPL